MRQHPALALPLQGLRRRADQFGQLPLVHLVDLHAFDRLRFLSCAHLSPPHRYAGCFDGGAALPYSVVTTRIAGEGIVVEVSRPPYALFRQLNRHVLLRDVIAGRQPSSILTEPVLQRIVEEWMEKVGE